MFEIGQLTRLPLGYVGESGTRTISIDMKAWLDEYPGALIMVQVIRPVDHYKYPAAYTKTDGVIHWTVDGSEVMYAGKGLAQIALYNPDTKQEYKSRVVGTIVAESLDGFNDIMMENNDPASKWVNQVLEAANVASSAQEKAEEVMNSIPRDYKTLSGTVSALTEETAKNTEEIGILNKGGLVMKEDFIGQQVNDWLDEHPEATTTVQDGSLSVEKFTDNAKLRIEKDYVTPQMFGSVGNGIADDTTAFLSALASGKDVYIPAGTYKITSTLNVPPNVRLYGTGESTVIDTECGTLFNVASYYIREPRIERMCIRANKRTVLYCSINTWGGSVRLKDIYITNASDKAIVFSECFNVLMENVRIEADSTATGTLVYLSDGGSTFSNLVHLSDCFFMGNVGRIVNLIDVGTANGVNLINCALQAFNIAVKGKANLYSCWIEDGTTAFTHADVFASCLHIANVETVLIGKDETVKYLQPTLLSFRRPYYAGTDSLMKQVFDTRNDDFFRLIANGTINGNYEEFDVLQWRGGKLVSNVPFNTDFFTGNANEEFYPALNRYYKPTTGTILIKFSYYRIHDNAVAQVSKETGVMKNGVYTKLENEESNAEYPTNITWDISNNMFIIKNLHGSGTYICTMEVQRISAT